MKRHLTTGLLVLVYGAGSLLLSVLPHEHHGEHAAVTPNGHCAACVWQLTSTTDEPLPPVTAQSCSVALPYKLPPIEGPSLLWFVSSTLERAPPETTA